MIKRKLRVGIIFGGRSAEHEVSLNSARNVYNALDKSKYEAVLIGITKEGHWQFFNSVLTAGQKQTFFETKESEVKPLSKRPALVPKQDQIEQLDVVFPVLHGPYGEDGTIQGLLKLAGIPFVGSDVLGSAIGMDKDVMKRLLKEADIPICRYKVVRQGEKILYEEIVKELGKTLFVKPANLGSSVGVYKVKSKKEYFDAIQKAFQYDTKILIEEAVDGREIECAVLGNDNPIASVTGEIILHHEYYSYEAKYIDPKGAEIKIPANISEDITHQIQELAKKTFLTLCCQGMARVDFFLTEDNTLYVNEINTIPGFTNISMYPKLWEASGIPYSELITRLIDLAIESHKKTSHLKTSYI